MMFLSKLCCYPAYFTGIEHFYGEECRSSVVLLIELVICMYVCMHCKSLLASRDIVILTRNNVCPILVSDGYT